ncbi:MAG: imidazoleglycerol-phosphate dehydratase HisB [Candidatus Gastranaerophilales bacterium]|nr:imidazoleglycerol-phosphate dehydratase HisB [Candidatus Gastranaerophilales bacterium]
MQIVEKIRNTKETQISLKFNPKGRGIYKISTGFSFLNHMLEQFAYHGLFDVELSALSLDNDMHHITEDIAIVLGGAFLESLGDKKGIVRYSNVILPMDDALVLCAVDISGRGFCKTDFNITDEKTSDFETVLLPHFYNSFATNALLTLHIKQLEGQDTHHIIECSFKALAKALKSAIQIDPDRNCVPSTKAIL